MLEENNTWESGGLGSLFIHKYIFSYIYLAY